MLPPLSVDTANVQHVLARIGVEADVDDTEAIQGSVRANGVCAGVAQVIRYTGTSIAAVGGHDLWRCGGLLNV